MKRLLVFALLSLPAFAQVTSIGGSDKLKDSRAVINTNFSNLQSQKQAVNYAADTGAADVYVVTLSPALASLADASLVTFKASATNLTTAPTLNVNGLGAKVIKKQQNVALAASDIVANGIIAVRYNTDCTCWQMQSQAATAATGGGTGTVTGSGLTSTHVIKGAGSAAIAVSGCTIDSSDNMACPGTVTSGSGSGASGSVTFNGSTSGSAKIQAATTQGSPNPIQLPTLTGTSGYVLSTDGGSPQQTSWIVLSGGAGAGPIVTAYNTASYSAINNGPNAIAFDTNVDDTSSGALHSTSVNPERFTASKTGHWSFSCLVDYSNDTALASHWSYIFKNGSQVAFMGATSNVTNSLQSMAWEVSRVIQMNSGDYLECRAFNSHSVAPNNGVTGTSATFYFVF